MNFDQKDASMVEEKSYFKIDPEFSSDALNEAIELATVIIRGNMMARILLDCNAPDYTIQDLHIGFMNRKLQIETIGADDRDDRAYLYAEQWMSALFFHPNLIDLATLIKKEDTGYKRLVVFLAVTMIHEGARYMHNNTRTSLYSTVLDVHEAGSNVDERLLSGVIEVYYDLEKPNEFKLILANDLNNPLTMSSSRPGYSNSLLRPDGLNVTTNIQELDVMDLQVVNQLLSNSTDSQQQPSVKLKVSLTNRSKRMIHLPTHVLPLHSLNLSAFLLKEDGSKSKLSKRCSKTRSMGSYEASPLGVGQSREYDLKDLNNIFAFKTNAKYEIHFFFRIKVRYSDTLYHFASNENIVTMSWPSHQENNKETSQSHSRIPLREFCQSASVYVRQIQP